MSDDRAGSAPTIAAAPAVVEFKDVCKVFNPGTPQAFKTIDDVSFSIADLPGKGEFIAVLGPSGCGKSTLLNLIAGFREVYPPTSGEILVRGEPIAGPGIDRGMVFQKYSSFPHLTVYQNVRFGLDMNRERLGLTESEIDTRAKQWIERVGLQDHVRKYPHQLSGGQQQRVAIARTLVLKPRILLMDEAFSALDEPTRLEMQHLLVALWTEVQATVFMVTHSIMEAVYLGDRIWVFTPCPGRIAREIANLPRAVAGVPARELQKTSEFLAAVESVSTVFSAVERGDG